MYLMYESQEIITSHRSDRRIARDIEVVKSVWCEETGNWIGENAGIN